MAWAKRIDMKAYLLEKVGKDNIAVSDDEWQINCPVCERDTKKHLWFNVKKRKGICYKCSTSFDPLGLVMAVEDCGFGEAVRVLKDRLPSRVVTYEKLRHRVAAAVEVGPEEEEDEEEEELATVKLPYYFIDARDVPEKEWPRYFDRVGSPKVIRDYGIGWCETGYFAQRMIVPITHEGRVVSFVGRAMFPPCRKCGGEGCPICGGREEGCQTCCKGCGGRPYRKVLYPKGHSAGGSVLFNYDRAKEYDRIVLVEGVFDAFAVGPRAVGVLKSNLSNKQAELLVASAANEFVIMLDPDDAGMKGARKAIDLLAPFGHRLRLVVLPEGRDPGSFKRADLWRMIERSPVVGSGDLGSHIRRLLG